jgi:Tfp pilus assembly protein PilO
MKSLPKDKRDRLVLVALATVAVLVGLYYGVVSSQRRSLDALAKRKADQEGKLSGAERLAGSVSQFQKNLDESSGKLKAIESSMASGDMYSWVILTVNNFKENYKIDIPQFSREVPGEVGMLPRFPYRAAVFHIRGTAHYHDFGRFVADFENSFPYMRIQNIELDPSGGSSANKVHEPEKLAFKMEIVALVNPNSSKP